MEKLWQTDEMMTDTKIKENETLCTQYRQPFCLIEE